MKKIILAVLFIAACGGSPTKPAPVAPDAGPTVLEMCSDFRNPVCALMGRCGAMEYDECIAALDANCEQVSSVSDPVRLYSKCLPDLAKVSCEALALPESCYELFNK